MSWPSITSYCPPPQKDLEGIFEPSPKIPWLVILVSFQIPRTFGIRLAGQKQLSPASGALHLPGEVDWPAAALSGMEAAEALPKAEGPSALQGGCSCPGGFALVGNAGRPRAPNTGRDFCFRREHLDVQSWQAVVLSTFQFCLSR